ncbi:hypothetical protein [Psychromonas aquimarina]|uniref:hypothetical protein n=1 Tax=Psychromonas aquimarina TaxID=444919 RepID=UPI000427652D|nr:hypothetical protein [Psychromonas aquimarina]
MAEENGIVVIKAPTDLLQKIKNGENSDIKELVEELAVHAQIDSKLFKSTDCRIEDVDLKSGYVCFNFECSDWSKITIAFVRKGSDIEFYTRVYDEYGTNEFYALDSSGKRFGYSFDDEGDACEQDGFEEEVESNLNAWIDMIPSEVKTAFPRLPAQATSKIEELAI